MDFPANSKERGGYALDFSEEFDGAELDRSRWYPYMLPHWSSASASVAHYGLADGRIKLLIEEDQEVWRPDGDRVSNLQTGHFSGPKGSDVGQFRVDPAFVVTTDLPVFEGYVPRFGYFETRVKATPVGGCHTALWMIGFDTMEAGEIQVFEIHGRNIGTERSRVDHGVLPWSDPSLVDERHQAWLPIDASEYHVYGVDWTPRHIDFCVDNARVRRLEQSPQYPMQFMLGVYETPSETPGRATAATYPIACEVDYFRGYRRVS